MMANYILFMLQATSISFVKVSRCFLFCCTSILNCCPQFTCVFFAVEQLLNESEATIMRLTEQAKILKEEIRRLERNQARENAISNMEYLKNIVFKVRITGPFH